MPLRKWCSISRPVFLLAVLAVAVHAHAQCSQAWPEADRLFHTDPLWLGADGAFSTDLGHDRVLWIFNDSLIAHKPGEDRKHAAFVHDSVAIQQGHDPAHATIRFYWPMKDGSPTELYPNEDPVWMWPSAAIRVGDRLLLFATRIGADHTAHSLGFKLLGWEAYWVNNPDEEPSAWKLEVAARKDDSIILASSLVRDGAYVYVYAYSEPKHDLYVARMKADDLAAGHFNAPEWWTGKDWQTAEASRQPIAADAGTEASVQRDPYGKGFIEVHSKGFPASDLVAQRASALTGPWSAPVKLYRPEESGRPTILVYAGKSHPELRGADLVVTYAANGPDETVQQDMRLYFPRFVKVSLARGCPAGKP